MGFLFLLFLTVLFATGALFLTYQLDNFKNDLERELEARLGANLEIGPVSVNGIRGLRIRDLTVVLPFEHGPSLTMTVPEANLGINFGNLARGQFALDRLTLDDATIEIVRPLDADWYSEGDPTLELDSEVSPSTSTTPFRIEGKNGTITVRNIVQESSAVLSDIEFSISRQSGSRQLTTIVNGILSNDPRKRLALKASYERMDDFSVRIEQSLLTAEDAQIIFPSDSPLVLTGEISPTVRIYGGPDNLIILNLRTPFENLLVRDQPDFIDQATGELAIFASYNTVVQELDITHANVESEQITGSIDGSIYFPQNYPLFDLQLLCTQLPTEDIIESILDDQLDNYGTLDFDIEPQQQLVITLQGTSDNPIIKSEASAKGGKLVYTPNNDQYPPIELTLGAITGTWDALAGEATGSIDILDGTIVHEQSNLSASGITGTLVLADNAITLNPLNAVITENAFVGSFFYDLESEDATITLNGTVQGLEDTSYHDSVKNITLAGALNVKAEGRKRGNEYFLDAQVEASQTQIDYMWWFSKPPGVGATGYIHGHIVPDKSYRFDFDADLASSQMSLSLDGVYYESDSAFHLMKANLTSNYLDVTTVGSCVTLPYRITGSTGGYGYINFERDPENFEYSEQTFGAFVDGADLLPIDDNVKEPMHFEHAAIEVSLSNSDVYRGTITLTGETVNAPPFTSTWFVPLEPPEAYPPKPRDWKYAISTDRMALPPWKGKSFSGEGYSTPTALGFNEYSVSIDGGSLNGTYHAVRAENSYKTTVQWDSVPIHYFLEHLGFQDILTGTTDGAIQYGIDKDDPSTLTGNGDFGIRDGQFSADFLYTLLGGDGEGLANLPPRLEFTTLHSSVQLVSDKVETPDLSLESEGLSVRGGGHYFRDGDLNYIVKVKLSPEMAESIPSMAEGLNLQGYKLSGQSIELTFNVVGPTFGPRGELAELPPASVTLVTGAGELLRESFNVIDTPRRMLFGLIKTIAGAVGAGGSK